MPLKLIASSTPPTLLGSKPDQRLYVMLSRMNCPRSGPACHINEPPALTRLAPIHGPEPLLPLFKPAVAFIKSTTHVFSAAVVTVAKYPRCPPRVRDSATALAWSQVSKVWLISYSWMLLPPSRQRQLLAISGIVTITLSGVIWASRWISAAGKSRVYKNKSRMPTLK